MFGRTSCVSAIEPVYHNGMGNRRCSMQSMSPSLHKMGQRPASLGCGVFYEKIQRLMIQTKSQRQTLREALHADDIYSVRRQLGRAEHLGLFPLRSFSDKRSRAAPGRAKSPEGDPLSSKDVKTFYLADIGEGIQAVQLLEWHVAHGQEVSAFDPLCSAMSDKATVEITVPFSGKITKIYPGESRSGASGQVFKVGEPLVDIAILKRDVDAGSFVERNRDAEKEKDASQEQVRSKGGQEASAKRTLATPQLRGLAKARGIDLHAIRGSGPEGRILIGDLERHVQDVSASPATDALGTTTSTSRAPVHKAMMTNIQSAMYKSMTDSLSIPHFYYSEAVRMDELLSFYEQIKAEAASESVKFSLLTLWVKITSIALLDFPFLLGDAGALSEAASTQQAGPPAVPSHHINIAIDLGESGGLTVPVLKDIRSHRSLLGLNAALQDLIGKAKSGQLELADLKGGQTSLSNIGSLDTHHGGGFAAGPRIMPGQRLIGAFTRIHRQLIILNRKDVDGAKGNGITATGLRDQEQVQAASMLNVHWAADHRWVDGASLARFSARWKYLAEHPTALLCYM